MSRFEVEYNFVDTEWGRRPMNMRGFDTREEAEAFAATMEDANIVESIACWQFTTTGRRIRIW